MNITSIETIAVAIPYKHDGALTGFGGTVWPKMSYLLIKVTTEDGLTGWGEAFGYNAIPATIAAMETIVKPLAQGQDTADIAALMHKLKKPLHIFGRSGPVQYALSGLDIALWDIAGKRAGKSVAALLSKSTRTSVPAYKSFMRLTDPEVVSRACKRALQQGYKSLKLHEISVEAVAAAREAIGDETSLTLDVNCEWRADDAIRMAERLAPYKLKWLEEPVWPPEDLAGLMRLRRASSIPVALGENLANAPSFMPLIEAGAVDYFQPSVTKVGGISELRDVAEAAASHGRTLAPHSPYFGPGLLATLQLAGAYPHIGEIEVFGVDLENTLFGDVGRVGKDGVLKIPEAPGLGADPEPQMIERYRIQ